MICIFNVSKNPIIFFSSFSFLAPPRRDCWVAIWTEIGKNLACNQTGQALEPVQVS